MKNTFYIAKSITNISILLNEEKIHLSKRSYIIALVYKALNDSVIVVFTNLSIYMFVFDFYTTTIKKKFAYAYLFNVLFIHPSSLIVQFLKLNLPNLDFDFIIIDTLFNGVPLKTYLFMNYNFQINSDRLVMNFQLVYPRMSTKDEKKLK